MPRVSRRHGRAQITQRAIAKRIASSAGSLPEPRTTLTTEPLPDGVSVTKYARDPTVMSVTPLCCDCSVLDRRVSAQLAIPWAGRCGDTEINRGAPGAAGWAPGA